MDSTDNNQRILEMEQTVNKLKDQLDIICKLIKYYTMRIKLYLKRKIL